MKKKRFIRSGIIAVLGVGIIALTAHADIWDKPSGAFRGIKASKHNLSNWSLYTIKGDTTQVCIFCHAPHNTDSVKVPLWNRNDTAVITFTMATTQYVKAGQEGVDTQPTTISKKCLSCHDGTIAIGDVRNGAPTAPITMANCGTGKLDEDCSLKNSAGGNPFGDPYDLRGGHVISFNYDKFYTNAGNPSTRFKTWNEIKTAGDDKSMFDRDGKMQCHTCHDPHTDWCDDSSKTIGKDPFWRKACDGNGNGSVCNVCHKSFADYTAPNLKF